MTLREIAKIHGYSLKYVRSLSKRDHDWPDPVGSRKEAQWRGAHAYVYDPVAIADWMRSHRLGDDQWTMERIASEFEVTVGVVAAARKRAAWLIPMDISWVVHGGGHRPPSRGGLLGRYPLGHGCWRRSVSTSDCDNRRDAQTFLWPTEQRVRHTGGGRGQSLLGGSHMPNDGSNDSEPVLTLRRRPRRAVLIAGLVATWQLIPGCRTNRFVPIGG